MIEAFAPGRVNLIGEHTDYTGGYALPMAVHLGTTVEGHLCPQPRVRLRSDHDSTEVVVDLDPASRTDLPAWGTFAAAVVDELRPQVGFDGWIHSTLPIGAGLSSSASFAVALALALGFDGDERSLARLAQRAEQRSTGVPCGLLDQIASTSGRAGHAILVDNESLDVQPVPLPDGLDVVVVDSGERRKLADSAYATRRRECEQAAERIGSLRTASTADLAGIDDPVVRRRARHVIGENERVLAFVHALADDDVRSAGELLLESHQSLRNDFEVSTPTLDGLVDELRQTRGVHGARLTGAGFGGCVIALADPGALDRGWTVRAAPGARRRSRPWNPPTPDRSATIRRVRTEAS